MAKAGFIPVKLRPWIEARKKFNLSHAQIQMARELGLNPKKLGNLSNHEKDSWKLPLPQYIEKLYFKNFKKKPPEDVHSIEQLVKYKAKRKEERKIEKSAKATATNGTEQGRAI